MPETPATAPATAPADVPATAPATQPIEPPVTTQPDAAADEVLTILDRLETQGKTTRSLKARVYLNKLQGVFDQEQRRYADFEYLAASQDRLNPMFAVRFDLLRVGGEGGRGEPIDEQFRFDGMWLLETDGRRKQATRRQLLRPGEKLDMMSNQAFPVPLAIETDEVLDRYRVEKLAAPAAQVRLKLTPRRPTKQSPKHVTLTFDEKGDELLPRLASVLEANGDRTEVRLLEVETNVEVDAKAFDTTLPRTRGWDTQTVPLVIDAED